MKISLISSTPDPVDLLLFTKQTRLKMSPGLREEVKSWSEEKKLQELEYMSRTIPSSWEFVNFVFLVEDVTRAFTHQLVRTRTASFAQQAMRIVIMSDEEKSFDYGTGPSISENEELRNQYEEGMKYIDKVYRSLIDNGAKAEDARGILPTNIYTNIVVQMNLRVLSDTYKKRISIRAQGEYREFVDTISNIVIDKHPWAELFIKPRLPTVVQKLQELSVDISKKDADFANRLGKEVDILKQELGQ